MGPLEEVPSRRNQLANSLVRGPGRSLRTDNPAGRSVSVQPALGEPAGAPMLISP